MLNIKQTINNRINLDPKIWGSYGWLFIESCLLSYPNNPSNYDKTNFKNFIDSIKFVLPCSNCRNHFSTYIDNNPLDDNILLSKENILKWILGAKNNVKKMNGKKELSYDEFIKYYINFYSITNLNQESCSSTCNKKCLKKKKYRIFNENIIEYMYIIIFIIIIFLSLRYYKKIQI